MTGPESYDVSKLLTGAQARKLLSYIVENGTVVILPHAKAAAGDVELPLQDRTSRG